jgi:hypothetical protein
MCQSVVQQSSGHSTLSYTLSSVSTISSNPQKAIVVYRTGCVVISLRSNAIHKGPRGGGIELGWPGRSHKTIYLFSPFFSFSATRVRISFHVILSISGWSGWCGGRPAAELLLDNCAASLVYTHITTINRIRRERG